MPEFFTSNPIAKVQAVSGEAAPAPWRFQTSLSPLALAFAAAVVVLGAIYGPPLAAQMLSPSSSNASSPLPAGRIRVDGAAQNAKLQSQVRPEYPPLARQASIQGSVVLDAVIDKQGKVSQLEVISGHPLLVPAALDAVKQWRYGPTLVKGEPMEVDTTITVTFTMADSPSLSAVGPQDNSVQGLEDACDRGDAVSCTHLGLRYLIGQGAPRDESRAAPLLQKSCDGGIEISCEGLGFLYENGRGVTKDEGRAVQLYRESCDKGVADACAGLAKMYASGRGVTKDESRAAQLYGSSCDGGNALACSFGGDMYAEDRGVPKDESRAAELYQRGCDRNIAIDCGKLGEMYRDGRGVTRDETRASQLQQKGCDLGGNFGCDVATASGVAGQDAGDYPYGVPLAKTGRPPSRLEQSASVTSSLIVEQTRPVYPPLAEQAHVQGNVLLRAVIDKDGRVAQLEVISGHLLLIQSALEAVKHWRYKPVLLNGNPVEVETTITVNFAINK